ncbi:DUF6578 domain-containing protein [Curtobacterium oceanosedimentum]|uniref:DUF6578 domain-containing protein n=1 Tax=Curtobacterium oceanosedimentum TaxID=465820 RepID=UPI00128F16D3|nr:DUF6578 domain-containing protein [Curtobacterium oceanosedimentum]
MAEADDLMKVWVPRWYLEDAGLEFAKGQNVSWLVLPANAEWYKDMLGADAPTWEIDSVASDSSKMVPISGAIGDIWAIAPKFSENPVRSAVDRWPSGASAQRLDDTSNIQNLDISIHVTGFVVEVEIDS